MTDRQIVDLGCVLKQCEGFEFSMKATTDRLRLQHFIYMLQAYDVYLGYDFSWYVRGPYCTTLSRRGFELTRSRDDVPVYDARFADGSVKERFKAFRNDVSGMDQCRLADAALLHMLRMYGASDMKATRIAGIGEKRGMDILRKDVWPILGRCHINYEEIIVNQSGLGANHDDMDEVAYSMLEDAAGTNIRFFSKRIFRREYGAPKPDMLLVDETPTAML